MSIISAYRVVHTLRSVQTSEYCAVCPIQQFLWGWPKQANHLSEMGFAKVPVAFRPEPIKE